MSGDLRLATLRRAATWRRLAIAQACALPPALALIVLAARAGGSWAGLAVLACAVVVLGVLARRALHVDAAWLARRLDAASPAMDDSAALLFEDVAKLSNLQRLQHSRLRTRLGQHAIDLRPAWPRPAIVASAGAACAILVVAALWSPSLRLARTSPPATNAATNTHATSIVRAELAIAAPAYTQLPARHDALLDARAPEGSRIGWQLRFNPQPNAATLVFHDGRRLALAHNGVNWVGEHTLSASTLYRIALDGAPPLTDDRLYRLDAIADLPPEVRVIAPDKTLTLLDAQQKTWDLAFDASDDYGIAHADLTITLAQGTGENIAFKEQTITLTGTAAGNAHTQHYEHTLNLAALGLSKGDDVIVRLAVSDNREPKPNVTRSASFILRWPVDPSSESAGLEGVVQHTMPAYFRSQRQIIIDSEALLAAQPSLDVAKFQTRSDSIGVDQKILRLRYGQFLGEESETHAGHAPESAHGDHAQGDAGEAPTQVDALAAAHEAQERQLPTQTPEKFGAEGNTLAEYGHVHDIAEAATLLDAQTKATLKSALNEMWQAELHLRQADPASALPYEHRALEFIKQVQQSTRIYLARVGLELPVPDETRRLSGERKDLADRVGTLGATASPDAALTQLWQALDDPAAPDWSAAERWLRAHAGSVPEALSALAAIDTVRRDPACVLCRAKLRDLLWPLLPVPAAVSAPRTAPDAAGRAYLDALPLAADTGAAEKGAPR